MRSSTYKEGRLILTHDPRGFRFCCGGPVALRIWRKCMLEKIAHFIAAKEHRVRGWGHDKGPILSMGIPPMT